MDAEREGCCVKRNGVVCKCQPIFIIHRLRYPTPCHPFSSSVVRLGEDVVVVLRHGDGPPAIYLLERDGAAESIRGAYKTWGSK
jgi:hypothetical protein